MQATIRYHRQVTGASVSRLAAPGAHLACVCDLGCKVGIKASATRPSGLVAHACAAVPGSGSRWLPATEGRHFMREWVHGPFGLDAVKRQTVRSQRTVLVVVHSPVPAPCGPVGCRELRRCRGAP